MKNKLITIACLISLFLGVVIVIGAIIKWLLYPPLGGSDIIMTLLGVVLICVPVFSSIEFKAGVFKISLKKMFESKQLVASILIIFIASGVLFINRIPSNDQSTKGPEGPTTTFVTIGTGGISGVYYPTGGAIARIVNKKKDTYGIRCTVESTGGSVFNVNAIMSGNLQFGVVQSDQQYRAINGLGEWKDKGKQVDLRACFSIYPESITLVAAVDAGISDIADLRGKRVNIGSPGSDLRKNSIVALEAVGIDFKTDINAEGIKASEAASLLQDGRIDAFFYTVGHPSGSIKEAIVGRRKVRFASITGIEKLLEKYPFYVKSKIPVSLYPEAENTADVYTFGVKSTFVTSAKIPDDIVYVVVKEVFDNMDAFKKLHPAYAVLTRENMLQGNSAAFHNGALKYYKEVGLK